VSLGEYILYWYCDAPPISDGDVVDDGAGFAAFPASCSASGRRRQFVFAARAEEEPLTTTLQRVRTLPDLLHALAGTSYGGGSEHRAAAATVAVLALLGGNLVAAGRWATLLGLGATGLGLAILETRVGVMLVITVMAWLLCLRVVSGDISLEWAATEVFVVLSALMVFLGVAQCLQEDSRSYVLLLERHRSGVAVRNGCCMDVKLLVFDSSDHVRLVPQGGLLGGVFVPRGATHFLGGRPPYYVKVYAPWERELGYFEVPAGEYCFQATVPPLVLAPADEPRFTNSSEEHVAICVCGERCWTDSLWLPFAPVFARLRWPAKRVPPGGSVKLHSPSTLRVYGCGIMGSFVQHACARAYKGESAEFTGPYRWTHTGKSIHRSCSSLLHCVR